MFVLSVCLFCIHLGIGMTRGMQKQCVLTGCSLENTFDTGLQKNSRIATVCTPVCDALRSDLYRIPHGGSGKWLKKNYDRVLKSTEIRRTVL